MFKFVKKSSCLHVEQQNNLFSSNLGIRTFLLQTVSDLLNYDSDTIDLTNRFNIDKSTVLNNASILIEDLYDEYTDYFDLTTNLPASSYQYGGRGGGQAVGRNVSLPVRGIRVGCVASRGERAGTAPIGDVHAFFH